MDNLNKLYESFKEFKIGDRVKFNGAPAKIVRYAEDDMYEVEVNGKYVLAKPSMLKKESLDEEQRVKLAKSMYKKTWDELDDRQKQTILKLIRTLPAGKESLSPLDKLHESLKEGKPVSGYMLKKKDSISIKDNNYDKAKKLLKGLYDNASYDWEVFEFSNSDNAQKAASILKKSNIKFESISPLDKLHESLKEELKVDFKYIQQLKNNNIDFVKTGNLLLVDESDEEVLNGLGITYRR